MPSRLESDIHILMTGGTGFFGKSLLRALANTPGPKPRITVLSRNPELFLRQHPELRQTAHFIKGDVLAPETFPNAPSFTHVLHAATDSTRGNDLPPLERFTQIVTGTQNVLKYAASVGVTRFLLTSSGAAYGEQPAHIPRMPECYLGMPDTAKLINTYGIAKRVAELLCLLYRDKFGLETVIARCFTFVGPDLPFKAHFAIGNFIHDALHEKAIHVRGTGLPIRSYLDQRDLALWLLALLKKGSDGQIYNVGSDQAISIYELACFVRELLSPEKEVIISANSRDSSERSRNRYVPSIEKIKGDLNLSPRFSLAESILFSASPLIQ